MTSEPFCVDPGWVDAMIVQNPPGPTYRVLTYADGTRRFEHRCDRGERGVIICAPELSPGHRIVEQRGYSPWTIAGSILCPDCGTHGFVTEGRWADA